MSGRPLEQLTVREKFTGAERLSRELLEHLDRGFVPKVHELRRVVRPPQDADDEPVSDVTVRNHASRVLDSDQFTQQVYDQLDQYLLAIATEVGRIVNGE